MAVLNQDASVRERRRTTLLDVARAAGVSKAAASRALGGYTDIGPTTRQRSPVGSLFGEAKACRCCVSSGDVGQYGWSFGAAYNLIWHKTPHEMLIVRISVVSPP